MNHSSQSLPLFSPYRYSGWNTVYGRSCSSRYLRILQGFNGKIPEL